VSRTDQEASRTAAPGAASSPVGARLRQLRESRGVSLDEIARATRVGRCQLEALEAGDTAELPAPVFVKGFIRAYCEFLGAGPEDVLARYHEIVREPTTASGSRTTLGNRVRPSRLGSPIAVSLFLLLVLAGALVAVNLGLRTGASTPASTPSPRTVAEPRASAPTEPAGGDRATAAMPATVPTPSSAVTPAAAPTTTGTSQAAGTPAAPGPPTTAAAPAPPRPAQGSAATVTGVPAPEAASPPAVGSVASVATHPETPATPPFTAAPVGPAATPGGGQKLVVRAIERTWIRVQRDRGAPAEQVLESGTVREWTAERVFVLSVGNAGGLELTLNGERLPPLGGRGAVIRQLVLPSGATPPQS
jgi:cytoskeleton protein RodZ